MNRLIDFSDGENNYRVPESEVEAFKASVPNARQMSQFVGKDGSRYSVPEDEIEAFKASVPDAEAVNRFQLSNGERYTVQQSRMSKFLRSRQYREGDADAIAAKRAEIDEATPKSLEQSIPGAIAKGALEAADAGYKGGLRAAGKIAGAFAGIATGPLRQVGMLFGRNNALVKGMDWIDDKFDWFAEDLGVGLSSGDMWQDGLSAFGEIGSSAMANLMPWLVGGGAASKIAGKALFAANVMGAGGRSATDMYDQVKADGGDDAAAYKASLAANAASTAAAFAFGKLSLENYLSGIGARGAAKLIESEVKTAGKGFNGIVKAVANGNMRRDIAKALVGGAEEFVTEGAESFVLDILRQNATKDEVDFEEAALTALKDAAVGGLTGAALGGIRATEGMKLFRGTYEKQARAEVSQLMNDMAPGDIREMNPKAFDAAAKKRRLGGTVSRKDGEEIGLPPNWTQEQRNEVLDEWNHEQTARKEKRAKMDGQQEMALREEIQGFVGDTPEAQRVFDRIVMKLKDASVLDDPYQRENLVMQAAEAVYAEDQAQRVGGARQKARIAEKADHEARVAEAEAQAAEAAQRAENDAQERTNAEMLARETKRYNDFMLAHEEARAKGGVNETRTDEEHPEPEQAPRVTPPAGEAARSVEAGEAPSEVGGEVTAPKPAVEAPASAPTETQANTPPATTERAERNFDASDAVSTPTKPKTYRESKEFIKKRIGKRYTDGKKTYEITGLTKDGEVSFKITDKKGNTEENSLRLSGALTRIFGTKKTSAVWSEVETPKTEQNSQNRTKATADDVTRLADETVPTYLKAMEPSQSGGNIGEDYKIESNFANEVFKMVKGMSESELGEVSASLRKTFYAKGNPMPGGYKPLLDAASYALDAARAGKDYVRLPMPEHLRTRVKTTVETPKTEQNVPKTEIATWKDRAGNEHQIEGFIKSDGSKINIGEEIVVSHSSGIPYKGKVVSIGAKNVVIKTQGGMGGEAELKFPRSEIVGKRDTSTGKIETKAEPKTDAKVEPKAGLFNVDNVSQGDLQKEKSFFDNLLKTTRAIAEGKTPPAMKVSDIKSALVKQSENMVDVLKKLGVKISSSEYLVDRLIASHETSETLSQAETMGNLINNAAEIRKLKEEIARIDEKVKSEEAKGHSTEGLLKNTLEPKQKEYARLVSVFQKTVGQTNKFLSQAPKSENAPTITPAEAMKKLGSLGAMDVDTLTKALAREERAGHTERANMIRVLRDYKRGVGTNPNPQSDESLGGKYRASVEAAKPLDDPAFVAWAKKRGVAPTTQKRNEYDKTMADTLKNRLSRWIKGVSVNTVNFIAPEESGDVRHSIKQEEYDAWNKVLDDYEAKKLDVTKNYPVLSRMPAVLRKIGVNDLPITMYGGILQKITGEIETSTGDYHGIPVSELRKLQIELDNPIAVFDSATRDDSIVVLTRLVDNQNNERAVVALRLDQESSGSMRINAITSAYGKNKASFEKWVKEKRLLRYVNKEARNKSARWLQLPGDSKFRALNILTEKDFSDEELGRIIPKSDADSNDAAYLDAVNRGDMETAERMVREAAAKAMPNTKVVDEDGLPLVVYHGTKRQFTKFAPLSHFGGNIEQSLDRLGFYHDQEDFNEVSLDELESRAKSDGAQIMRGFLNIKNPLIIDVDLGSWEAKEFEKRGLSLDGHDGVVYDNWHEGRDGEINPAYIIMSPSQIKSADPVTYDDAGNVIPLSQRFNPESNDIRYLRDGERIVGSYNRATGEVKLAKGASVETVLHELGWHAARHWAEVNADSDPKAANLLNQMKEYAESAPKEIKDAVRDVYGDLDADTLLDEIGAARFTKEQSGKIAKAIATKEGAAWYQKVWNKVVDFYKNFLTKIGYNRVDLDGVENMSPEVFGDFLADVMMSGKQLGERTAFSMDAPKGVAAKWTNNLSDYKAPIAELEKRTTGSSNNIYYLARTLEGQAQRGKNRAERAIKRVEKILGEDISPELLAQYMQLKAYEERNAKIERRNGKADASGMTPEDARAIEKTINESGVDEAIFEEAAQILWDLQKEGLQARVDAGLLDQETANKWMTDEPHHIPWKDAVDPDSGEYVGRKVGASEFDTAEGRKTAASGDPITWMLQEYQDAMTRAAQNRLRSAIANLTRLNGDVGTIYDGIQTDSKGKRSFIKYPKNGGTAKVLSIPEGAKIESTVKNDGGMKNVLTFKEGGETKYLVLNGSLGEAVAGAVTGRTLSRPPAWISWTMRGYAATATSLSPAFAARNITADNFDIHNNLVAKYGFVKGEKMFGKVVKEQFLMTKQLGSYIKNGDFKLGKDGKITDFQKLVEAYEDAGGLIGGMATEGYDATVKKIQADFRAGRNKARSIGKSVATYWTMMQRMSELAPRLAVFKSAMESGMSAKDAAMLSREITVDFNKKGEKTPWFNTLWMFSNSALGSNLTQMKGLAGKTGAKLAGGLVMYGFAEGLLEALMNGDDDEREKEGLASGKDINEFTRQNSLYIRKGDKVFRVNIHMGPFAYAKYFGNVMARTFSGMISPEKAAKELGLTAAEVAASFTGLGNVSGDALVQTAVPTVLQPIVQIATNKDYAGRAIKRAKYTESQPYSSHGRKSTPPVYHWMAKRINELFGGNDYRKGKFLDEDMDIAPETVKVLTEMVGKNFVRDITEIAETGYKLLSGNTKDLDVRNVPFAGDVVRKQDGNDNRYYENYNRYRDDKHELKKQKGWTTDERRAYLKEHPWLYSAGKPGVTRIDNIVKRIEKLRDVEESDRATEERKAEAKATRRKLQARVIEIMTKK